MGGVDHGEVLRWYDEFGPALLACASALLRDQSAAEDVLHQVFLNLLEGRTRIAAVPKPYLFRAVRNAALNRIRDRVHDAELPRDGMWLESTSATYESSLTLQSALWLLPDQQREVIVLHIWGGLTFEEAGELLGISPNTAASRYRYGLSKLKEMWD